MSLKDSGLTGDAIRLPDVEAVQHVMNTAFAHATSVIGAFGWMDSGWISVVARGLHQYLGRRRRSPITFAISHEMFSSEYEGLERLYSGEEPPDAAALPLLIRLLDEGADPRSSAMRRHAVRVFCWMIANDLLILRIALPIPSSNFHPKVWVFEDGVEQVVVRGSANATGRGMERGIEHLDVDVTWESRTRAEKYVRMCQDWLEGNDAALTRTVRLDQEALVSEVRELSLRRNINIKDEPTIDDARRAEEEDMRTASLAVPGLSIPEYLKWDRTHPAHRDSNFLHQGDAVRSWESSRRRGVLAIATGGGKTIASSIAATRLYEETCVAGGRGPLLVLVSAPTRPLISQWRDELSEFGIDALTPTLGSKQERQRDIGDALSEFAVAPHTEALALVLTNGRLADPAFQRTAQRALRNARLVGSDPVVLHIGDEAHTLGAPGFLANLPDFTEYRLGLSATPIRQYDNSGTRDIFEYFSDGDAADAVIFEFSLRDAIVCGALVDYEYHLTKVHLDDDEVDEFLRWTAKIGAARGRGDDDDSLTQLLVRRRAVLEAAKGKTQWLKELLSAPGFDPRRTLLYTSSKDPDQFLAAHELLHEAGISHRQVTQETTSSQRALESALADFADGTVDMLIAKKVLDEGVNVPATKTAVFMASSTTEREWIQRLGRVLRTAPGKSKATVHDVIVLPPVEVADAHDSVANLVLRELERVQVVAACAANKAEMVSQVDEIMNRYLKVER